MTNRELDALVAEKVMGWTDVHFNGPTDRLSNEHYGSRPGEDFHACVDFFSTDIRDAWQVVEKMRLAFYYEISAPRGKDHSCKFWRFDSDADLMITGKANEETAPLAIVKAALRAKGIDV